MPASGRDGFTLVEVLIALAIFALISAAGVLLLSQVADTRFSLEQQGQRVGEVQRTLAVLKSDLSQATPRRVRSATGRPMVAPIVAGQLPGDPVLVLVRAGWSNPDGDPRPSLQRIDYRLADGRLERRAYTYLDGATAGPPQVLMRGVKSASVTLIQGRSEGPGYLTSSDRPLPDAVRLRLELEAYGPVETLFLVTEG